MRGTIFLSVIALLPLTLAQAIGISANPDGEYLVIIDGKLIGAEGTIKELTQSEYAFLSPGAETYAVLAFDREAPVVTSSVRVYGRAGNLLYEIAASTADQVYVADSGYAVLGTVLREESFSDTTLEFYDPSGTKTGAVEVGSTGELVFSPDGETLAVSIFGKNTRVFDMKTATEKYTIPYSRTLAADDNGRVFLVNREWVALYEGEREIWKTNHELYFPRLVQLNEAADAAVIGCHHEVALVDLGDGEITEVWQAPGDFGVTDIDAAGDFSRFVVGLRTLEAVEAVYLLDGDLKLLASEEHQVERPVGSIPKVAMLGGDPPNALAVGQGWQTTLTK